MSNVHELTVQHLGMIVDPSSHGEYAHYGHLHGNKLVRISHEAELRWGTFLGFARDLDDRNLQIWGHFYNEGHAGIAFEAPQPDGSTELTVAGTLHRGHLTPITGVQVRPQTHTEPAPGASWKLIRVEYDYDWEMNPFVLLIYGPEHDRGPFADGPRDYRLRVAPDTPMVAV